MPCIRAARIIAPLAPLWLTGSHRRRGAGQRPASALLIGIAQWRPGLSRREYWLVGFLPNGTKFPRLVWHLQDETLYEARLSNRELGEYHGYPLEDRCEWPAGI